MQLPPSTEGVPDHPGEAFPVDVHAAPGQLPFEGRRAQRRHQRAFGQTRFGGCRAEGVPDGAYGVAARA